MKNQSPYQLLEEPEALPGRRSSPGRTILTFFEFTGMALQITGYHLILGFFMVVEPPIIAAEHVTRRVRGVGRFFSDTGHDSNNKDIDGEFSLESGIAP